MKMELKIVDILARKPDQKLTINEIAKSTKGYYSFVHKIVKRMIKDEVITKNKAGKAFLCSLNFDNEKTLALIHLTEIERRNEFFENNKELKVILEDFVKSVETRPGLLSAVLFGSYSKENSTKESDIDILVIGKKNPHLGNIAKGIYAKYGKEINPVSMSSDEFEKQKDKVLIREIVSNHHILRGAGNFIGLVFKK